MSWVLPERITKITGWGVFCLGWFGIGSMKKIFRRTFAFHNELWSSLTCCIHWKPWMLDVFVYQKNKPNVGKYTLHGCSGNAKMIIFVIEVSGKVWNSMTFSSSWMSAFGFQYPAVDLKISTKETHKNIGSVGPKTRYNWAAKKLLQSGDQFPSYPFFSGQLKGY